MGVAYVKWWSVVRNGSALLTCLKVLPSVVGVVIAVLCSIQLHSGYVRVMQLVCSILLPSGYVGAAYVLKIRNISHIIPLFLIKFPLCSLSVIFP